MWQSVSGLLLVLFPVKTLLSLESHFQSLIKKFIIELQRFWGQIFNAAQLMKWN